MNEQINGLWWKARIGYNNQSCDPEVIEKFAELIVLECANYLAKNGEFNSAQNIKHLFGIER